MKTFVSPYVWLIKLLSEFKINLLFGVYTKEFLFYLYFVCIGINLGVHEAQIQFYRLWKNSSSYKN
jgi:hypothetical protein